MGRPPGGGGDLAGAEVLRGLAGAGVSSLHALAIGAIAASTVRFPDRFGEEGSAFGWGMGDQQWPGVAAGSGFDGMSGVGLGDWISGLPVGEAGLGHGSGDGFYPGEGIGRDDDDGDGR